LQGDKPYPPATFPNGIWAEIFPLPYKPAFLSILFFYPPLGIILVSTPQSPTVMGEEALKCKA